jgi:ParB family transcriptional regulator, chromosome partitioning protein
MQMSNFTNENINKKSRLGRGLGSLLGENSDSLNIAEMPMTTKPAHPAAHGGSNISTTNTTVATANPIPADARIWQIGIDKLFPGEFQPRTEFEKESLEELATSIRQNGILQPILARKLTTGKYEIIAGERRWRAAQLAGLHSVPALLKPLSNQEALEIAIIENIQREDLNPIDEADAYRRLATEFSLTQQQVADKVGKDRATVANSMRLLQLPEAIRTMVSRNEISAGHAKVLLSLDSAELQTEWAKKVLETKISVRELEREIASANSVAGSPKHKDSQELKTQNLVVQNLAEELQKTLGTKVAIDYRKGKGKIQIHFYSDEELTNLVHKLKEKDGRRNV